MVSVRVPTHKSESAPFESTPNNKIFCLLGPKGKTNSGLSFELLLKDNLDNRVEIKECSPNLPFKNLCYLQTKKLLKLQ